jgi:hypothetical protein
MRGGGGRAGGGRATDGRTGRRGEQIERRQRQRRGEGRPKKRGEGGGGRARGGVGALVRPARHHRGRFFLLLARISGSVCPFCPSAPTSPRSRSPCVRADHAGENNAVEAPWSRARRAPPAYQTPRAAVVVTRGERAFCDIHLVVSPPPLVRVHSRSLALGARGTAPRARHGICARARRSRRADPGHAMLDARRGWPRAQVSEPPSGA